MQGTERRAFLRGQFSRSRSIRPFGALEGIQFEDICTGCGDCALACAAELISLDQDGFPVVDPLRGECTFCNACTEACEAGALVSGTPWPWRAKVGSGCLSANGVYCRACQDHCPTHAIKFRLAPGGRADAAIDLETCTGCGACAAPCPVGAIQLTPYNPPAEAPTC